MVDEGEDVPCMRRYRGGIEKMRSELVDRMTDSELGRGP